MLIYSGCFRILSFFDGYKVEEPKVFLDILLIELNHYNLAIL